MTGIFSLHVGLFNRGAGSVDHRESKMFPLTTGFLYAQDPFKGGFTV